MQEIIRGVLVKAFRWNEKLPEKLVSKSQGMLVFLMRDSVEQVRDPTGDQILGAGYKTEDVNVIYPPVCARLTVKLNAFFHRSCTEENFLKAISLANIYHPNNHKLIAKLATQNFLSCFSFETLTVLDPESSPKLVLVMEVYRRIVVHTNANSLEATPGLPKYFYESHNQREEKIKETPALDHSEEDCSNSVLYNILGYLRLCLQFSPRFQLPTKKQVSGSGFVEIEAAVKIVNLLADGEMIEDRCAICLEGFFYRSEEYLQIAELPCSHKFHTQCAYQWLPNHGSCPMCRSVCTISI